MFEDLRSILYYPLGILPSIFFTSRVLVQWLESEKRKQSYNGAIFWKLSIAGNLLLFLHYSIQIQYPFAMLQAGNAVISWRNLDLLKDKNRYTFFQTIWIFLGVFSVLTSIFFLQGMMNPGEIEWIRIPGKIAGGAQELPPAWHYIGALGGILFASRFWLQWWEAEKEQKSALGKHFWQLSIAGSLISIVYFFKIGDAISILNYGFGFIPYIRNLMLIQKSQALKKRQRQ